MKKQALIALAENGSHDEYWTPAYAVTPLLKHIPKGATVWECTDTEGKSEIARVLREHGCTVVTTGRRKFDFLFDEPDFHFDYIITNPPYSKKDQFIERCYELKKPWAMLMPLTTLEGVVRGQMFRKKGLEVMVFDRRVEYIGKSCWFSSAWFCNKVLKQKLIFAELVKENK